MGVFDSAHLQHQNTLKTLKLMEKSYAQQFKEDYLTINPHAPAADILAAWREREREERAQEREERAQEREREREERAQEREREREERALALLNDPNATNDAKDVARQILTGEDARNALILSLKCTLYFGYFICIALLCQAGSEAGKCCILSHTVYLLSFTALT